MKAVRASFVPLCLAVAPLLVLPGASDAFELPKRLAWGVLATGLALAAALPRPAIAPAGRVGAAGWGLLAWMAAGTAFASMPFWAAALPLVAWATPLLLLLLASRLRWSEGERCRIVRVVAVLGVAEAALMLCQRLGFDPLFGEATSAIAYPPGRMVGTIGYQNQAAEFLGIAVICVFAGWRSPRSRAAFAVPMFAALALSANRGALLALAASAVVVAAPRLPRRRRAALAAAGAAILLGAAALGVPEVRARIADFAHPSRSSAVQSRLWMWKVACDLWSEGILFGTGAGSYALEYVDILGELLPERKEHEQLRALVFAREAHCDPLQFAAEFGLAGIALLAVLAASLAGALRRRPPPERAAAAAVAVFATVASCFSFTWQTVLAGPLAGFLLGMWSADESDSPGSGPAVRALGTLAVVPPAGLVAVIALATAQSLRIAGVPLHGADLAAAAAARARGGDPVGAIPLFLAAEREGVSPEILHAHGAALAAQGRWDAALAVFKRWSQCGIRHDEALRNESVCLERLGRPSDAAAREEERLRLFPGTMTDAQVYRLAALHMMAREPAAARKIAERFRTRCLRMGNDGWTARWDNLLGGALLSLDRPRKARLYLESALLRDPSLESARRNLRALDSRAEQLPP